MPPDTYKRLQYKCEARYSLAEFGLTPLNEGDSGVAFRHSILKSSRACVLRKARELAGARGRLSLSGRCTAHLSDALMLLSCGAN